MTVFTPASGRRLHGFIFVLYHANMRAIQNIVALTSVCQRASLSCKRQHEGYPC